VITEVLSYQKRGMSIIPLKPEDKRPLLASWKEYQKKPLNIGDLKAFWHETPEANVGIITGAISGITVVDVDGEEGVESLRKAGVQLPETYTVKTPNGWHYYYKYNNLLRTGAGFLDHVDVRNDAGYVVAPPSKLDNDRCYTVQDANNGEFAEFTRVPECFTSKAGTYKQVDDQSERKFFGEISEALENGVSEPGRNDMAYRISRYLWRRGVAKDVIWSSLRGYAKKCSPPMSENELQATFNSAVGRAVRMDVRSMADADVTEPVIQIAPNGDVNVGFDDMGVAVNFAHVRKKFNRIDCMIEVKHSQVGVAYGPVAFDMTSMSKRREAVDALRKAVLQADYWHSVIDLSCRIAIKAQDDPGDFVQLGTVKYDPAQREWLIEGFLPKRQPTIIYADGGTGKSMVALATAMSVASNLPIIDGINMPSDIGGVLYLDWETDEIELHERMLSITRGLKNDLVPEDFPITYMRCTAPLEALEGKIKQWIDANSGAFVVIDSLIPALDGDANDSETARRFMNTLRSFNCTSLILSHTSKEGRLFGSSFWWNLARNVWELKKEQAVGDNYTDLGFVHQKSNNSQKQKTIGVRMKIDDGATSFTKIDVLDAKGAIAASVGIKTRIASLLRGSGALTVDQIVQELHTVDSPVTKQAVSMALTRNMYDKKTNTGMFVLIIPLGTNEKKYGLAVTQQ
jgi:hypothetical protein